MEFNAKEFLKLFIAYDHETFQYLDTWEQDLTKNLQLRYE